MNNIPPMTDPLGKYWQQPADIREVEMDDTHVLLTARQIQDLNEYSTSIPTGAYPGKCWKRWQGEWLLAWYGEIPGDAEQCSLNWRTILKV